MECVYACNLSTVLVNNNRQGAEKLYVGDAPTPKPNNGEVLVKIKAFGLNRMDILQREGQYPVPPGASQILGVEFSGIVEELGPNTGKWKVGDEVLGLATGGAYTEYIAIGADFLLPKPAEMGWEVASGIMENYVTAFQAIVTIAHLKEGETILIHTGASGVGTAALQLAKFLKAKHIFTTASSDSKLQFLHKLVPDNGILHTINYKSQDFEKEIKGVTGGKGVDVLIDFVGQSHWNQNLGSLALDGRMVMLGLLSGLNVEKTSLGPILFKRLQVTGSTLRSRSPQYQMGLVQQFGTEILPNISPEAYSDKGEVEGRGIQVVMHQVYPVTEIVNAHQDMENNASIGKIVITV
ncbi:quinone oxidoreductase putative [Serendipita vermifera]|nr:quinone oxidoreductase putative [Serendipita vermifera]